MDMSESYQITDKIYESENSAIFRGFRKEDQEPVVLKKLNRDLPTPIELARFRREFKIANEIRSNGIIKVYNVENLKNSNDRNGRFWWRVCKSIFTKYRANDQKKLTISIKIAEYLGQIHLNNVIHMDINPSNVVWNPQGDILKIIDFGISTRFANENPEIKNPNLIEGTLPYLSPEQTAG